MVVEAKLYSNRGEEKGTYKLPEHIFGKTPNTHVIYEAVKAYLVNQRQGTASVKNRSQVRGGGKKPYRQKGTGSARAGTRRSPLWVGGGTVFGPSPKNYSMKLPKKVRRLALVSALSVKARDNSAVVMEDVQIDTPKTKIIASLLDKMGLEKKKVLLLTGDYDKNIYLSGRNIKKLTVMESRNVNPYFVMNADVLLMTESAVGKLVEVFGNEGSA